MDIFDLELVEFEKKVDEMLETMTSEELMNELIECGLIFNEYNTEYCYDEDFSNNVWVHKDETSSLKNILSIFKKKTREKINLMEAA